MAPLGKTRRHLKENLHTTLGQLGEILKQLSEHFETTLGPQDDFFSRDGRFTQRGPALYEKNLESEYLGGGERKETQKKYAT